MTVDFHQRPSRHLFSTLIEPFKQIRMGAYVLLVSLIFLALALSFVGYAFYEQYQQLIKIFHVTGDSQWELVTNDVIIKNATILTALALGYIAILLAIVIKMTHKIYGPLVNIERFVDEIAQGDYSKRVLIRRDDELQRLVNKLNYMAECLQQRYGVPDRRQKNDPQFLGAEEQDHRVLSDNSQAS